MNNPLKINKSKRNQNLNDEMSRGKLEFDRRNLVNCNCVIGRFKLKSFLLVILQDEVLLQMGYPIFDYFQNSQNFLFRDDHEYMI